MDGFDESFRLRMSSLNPAVPSVQPSMRNVSQQFHNFLPIERRIGACIVFIMQHLSSAESTFQARIIHIGETSNLIALTKRFTSNSWFWMSQKKSLVITVSCWWSGTLILISVYRNGSAPPDQLGKIYCRPSRGSASAGWQPSYGGSRGQLPRRIPKWFQRHTRFDLRDRHEPWVNNRSPASDRNMVKAKNRKSSIIDDEINSTLKTYLIKR